MKLHWSPKSPFVRKVMVCAHELGCADAIALERSVAAMRVPNAALMRDNPLSKIPTLVLEHGACLFDSRVICEYLDDRFDGHLFPRAPGLRWDALRWQALGDGALDLLVLWRNERERDIPSEVLDDAFALKSNAVVAQLEREAPALAAAPFAIGHIAIGCTLGYLDYRFAAREWRASAPALADWFADVSARPSFAGTVPADG